MVTIYTLGETDMNMPQKMGRQGLMFVGKESGEVSRLTGETSNEDLWRSG